MVQLGTISQARSQMVDDHDDRISRLEQANITLVQSVQSLIQLAEQHDARMSRLEDIAAQHQTQMASLNASNERLDRIIDYLIRREGGDIPN